MRPTDVERALQAYTTSDERERSFRARMLALCEAADPFSRSAFSPGHFTASAFVLSPLRDAVLLIFHKKLGRWLQPGGHIEASDTSLIEAARREVAEETAIFEPTPLVPGVFDIDVHEIPARKDEPAHEHFDVRVLLGAPALAVTASDEVAAARWVPLGELATVETDESVRRAVRKIRALSGATAGR
jgi:8-oxo-dGTP pyrophosphatase MutT (NUDIX family)